MAKSMFLKSKYYRVNPWKKTIKQKPYDTQKKADWEGKSKSLKNTEVGFKGSRIPNLIKKHRFKVK